MALFFNNRYRFMFSKKVSSLLKTTCFVFFSAQVFFTTPTALSANKIAQLDFRNVTVGEALKALAEQSNLNIIASQKAAEIPVTMYLQNIRPLDVVDAIAKTYNLWYKHDKQANIIRLYTVQEYRMEQVEFKPEQTKIFTLKNAENALDLADTIYNLYGERVRLASSNRNEDDDILIELEKRFDRFDIIDSRTRQQFEGSNSSNSNNGNNQNNNNNNNFRNNNSRNNNSRNNRNNSFSRQNLNRNNRNNQDAVMNEEIKAMTELLNKNKELANLLAGEAGVGEPINIQEAPIYVSVIKRQNRVLVRTRDADAMRNIQQLYEQLDTQSAMMMMEVKILALDLGDDFNSLFDFKIKSPDSNISGGQNVTGAVDNLLNTAASAFNPALLATVVSDKFELRLQLLEEENRVTEIATPVLMTSNQEVSRIFIGEKQRPFLVDYDTIQIASGETNSFGNPIETTVLDPVIERQDVGTTLLLTPNINSDRTVSVRILIEQSNLSTNTATIPVVSPSTGDVLEANVELLNAQTFSGTVVAQDGTAIAVGGLIQERAGNRESKVPILGDIPGLGFFFREEAQERGRQELVVIIRPYIIATPAEGEQFNEKFMRKYSTHPNAIDSGNLNIYTNPTKEHKDYKLEEPFKEYPAQDIFDD